MPPAPTAPTQPRPISSGKRLELAEGGSEAGVAQLQEPGLLLSPAPLLGLPLSCGIVAACWSRLHPAVVHMCSMPTQCQCLDEPLQPKGQARPPIVPKSSVLRGMYPR